MSAEVQAAYAATIRAHLDILRDSENASEVTFNATRITPTPTKAYKLVVDQHVHALMQDDAGAYSIQGQSIYGAIDASDHTPVRGEIVSILGTQWRITRVRATRVIGGTVASYDVELRSLEKSA